MKEHTVKSYDEELARLKNLIIEMGGLAEFQLASAVQSVTRRDSTKAAQVIEDDSRVDDLEREVEALVIRLLALRQPMAEDLRRIITALKLASDLERIGDYAKNIAKRAIALSQTAPVRPTAGVGRIGKLALEIIKEILDAYTREDAAKARAMRERDEEIDELYTSLFREVLTYMIEDARNITACTHLLFIAKNIERIGDHATNVAEQIHYLVEGVPLEAERPKGDEASYTVVESARAQ